MVIVKSQGGRKVGGVNVKLSGKAWKLMQALLAELSRNPAVPILPGGPGAAPPGETEAQKRRRIAWARWGDEWVDPEVIDPPEGSMVGHGIVGMIFVWPDGRWMSAKQIAANQAGEPYHYEPYYRPYL
jgi:hypothetical protein